RRLEGVVRSTEDRYRRLVEQAGDAIFLLDPAGRVLEANRRAEQLLGRPAADVVGRPYRDFLPPAEVGRFAQLLAGDSARLADSRLRRADGRLAEVDLSTARADDGGD